MLSAKFSVFCCCCLLLEIWQQRTFNVQRTSKLIPNTTRNVCHAWKLPCPRQSVLFSEWDAQRRHVLPAVEKSPRSFWFGIDQHAVNSNPKFVLLASSPSVSIYVDDDTETRKEEERKPSATNAMICGPNLTQKYVYKYKASNRRGNSIPVARLNPYSA